MHVRRSQGANARETPGESAEDALADLDDYRVLFCLHDDGGRLGIGHRPAGPKLTGTPPAISVGGKDAKEIKDKIKSGAIKRVRPSLRVPEGVEASLAVEYGKGGQTPLLLDLFKPKHITRPVPGLIFVHGGSWSHGNRKIYDFYCEHLRRTATWRPRSNTA